jgi:hypothetical protein
VTQLSRHLEPGSRFQLLLDGGCFHGLPSEARDSWAREVTTIAAPGATLLMMAFDQGRASPGVQGTSRAEIDQRTGVAWDVIADAIDAGVSTRPQWPIRIYELRRR